MTPVKGRRGGILWWTAAVIAVVLVVWHAWSMSRYLDRVTDERFAASASVLPRERIQSGSAFDGQTWLRVSADMEARRVWRLRETAIDDAPDGREVFWSSGWAWWLIAVGKVVARVKDISFEAGLEHAARWVHVPVLLGLLLGLGGWVARRWGGGAAAVLAAGMVGHRAFYEGFLPGNPDHHGVIAGCVLGMVMGVLMAGAGWYRKPGGVAGDGRGAMGLLPGDETTAKRGLWVSAVFGGVGMWFSAASMVPAIAAVGFASAVASMALKGGMEKAGARANPSLWRVWGCVGAGVAFGFYVFENFPDRFGWRMEINHPCYCLAWWGGGECIALLLERGTTNVGSASRGAFRWIVAVLAIASPAVVVAWGGASVFVPADPFVVEVYRYVSELDSLGQRIEKLGFVYYLDYAALHPWLVALAAGLWWSSRQSAGRMLLLVAAGVALPLMGLGWWQNRWLLIASGPLIALAALMIAVLPHAVSARWRRGLVMLLVFPVFFLTPGRMLKERALVEERADIQALEAMQLLYRDIARVLKSDAGGREVVLLSSPDGSVSISYYANAASVGTLYWENVEGMKKAGAVYAAEAEATALAEMKRAGVTHVALVSLDNGIAEYAAAMRTLGSRVAAEDAFAARLLDGRAAPLWLRPVHYGVPRQFARLAPTVRLFAVDETQPRAEAHYRHGVAFALRQDYERALHHLWEASALAPDMPAPWFRIAEILLAKREYAEACDLMIMGVRLVGEADRAAAFREAAALFASHGAEAQAARLRALASATP